jgi:hypothetical protein
VPRGLRGVPLEYKGEGKNNVRGQDMASNEMKSANETYAGFVGLVKWGTIASVAVAALVVLLISS